LGELSDGRQEKRGDSGGGVEDVGVRDPKDSDAEASERFVTARRFAAHPRGGVRNARVPPPSPETG
jgi:hypothetical protein